MWPDNSITSVLYQTTSFKDKLCIVTIDDEIILQMHIIYHTPQTSVTEWIKPFHSSRASALGACRDNRVRKSCEKKRIYSIKRSLKIFSTCSLTLNLMFSSFIWRFSLAASNLRSMLPSSVIEINPLRSSFSIYWWNTHTQSKSVDVIKKLLDLI